MLELIHHYLLFTVNIHLWTQAKQRLKRGESSLLLFYYRCNLLRDNNAFCNDDQLKGPNQEAPWKSIATTMPLRTEWPRLVSSVRPPHASMSHVVNIAKPVTSVILGWMLSDDNAAEKEDTVWLTRMSFARNIESPCNSSRSSVTKSFPFRAWYLTAVRALRKQATRGQLILSEPSLIALFQNI